MKLKFKQQQYQADATDAVIRCFTGQSRGHRKETIARVGMFADEIFSNKKLDITDIDVLQNVKEIQKDQELKLSKQLDGYNFSVEMETGTGKTYVYTKTMFELNKQYGWSKFIIMVPSVAIREGVHKSLEITSEHFQSIYGKKIRFSIYNTKDKSNLVNIKSFANTANIEVIIMNYQAFGRRSKESLKIYQKLDVLQSERPIDIIKRARPILIIDEPQRFGDKAESMLGEFDPLFKLRYSATHKKDFNKIYKLDAIDAFNQRLVKKINVKGIEVIGNTGRDSYLFLDRINISKKSNPTASIELEIKQSTGLKKVSRIVSEGDDLYVTSNELEQYKGFTVSGINAVTDTVTFTNGFKIGVGQAINNGDERHIRRIQIRETIKSHLEKEKIMHSKGIKVLSLFFIDEVAKYRQYNEKGEQIKGDYEKVFEEEYEQAISQNTLFDKGYNKYLNKFKTKDIHKGYFSVDKKGKFIDSKEKRGENGSDDESAYDLIMKNKEKLLSFSEPTRFIFSHSALREGWDNPNVFQICTLKHAQSEIGKRQEIGRGLRICVNKHGNRMDHSVLDREFFDINTLTVIASESYDTFARDLQKEIFATLSNRPITLNTDALKDRVLENSSGQKFFFDDQLAMDLIINFKFKGYIDDKYKISDKLLEDIEKDKLEVPENLENFKTELGEIMKKISTNAAYSPTNELHNNISSRTLKPNENFKKKEFQDLWSKIKTKTVYDVDFDSSELIDNSVKTLNSTLDVRKVSVNVGEGVQEDEIDRVSVQAGTSMRKLKLQSKRTEGILGSIKYDLVWEVSKRTNTTRKTIVSILQGLNQDKFNQFKINPEDFIRKVIDTIRQEKATTLISNITYSKTNHTYDDDIFTINNFHGSTKSNIMSAKRHIYDYLKYDSDVEKTFATALESGQIQVYAKLPNGFKIPTPVGSYNPDWAIVFDSKDMKYIYFIAETKGSMKSLDLKGVEKLKIDYARKHFESLSEGSIKYDIVNTYEDLMEKVF